VTAGVLNQMDSDQLACQALGIDHSTEPPFSPIGLAGESTCAEQMRAAELIVITDVPFGAGNLPNLRMAAAAQDLGHRLVLLSNSPISNRDFTGGEATRLWNGLLEGGACVVPNNHALDALLHREALHD
jgi:iron complex transport system ATP-binding protein